MATVPLVLDSSRRPMITGRLLLQPRDARDARLLLDTAIADYALSLTKAFADREKILNRVITLIHPPFRGEGTEEGSISSDYNSPSFGWLRGHGASRYAISDSIWCSRREPARWLDRIGFSAPISGGD